MLLEMREDKIKMLDVRKSYPSYLARLSENSTLPGRQGCATPVWLAGVYNPLHC